MIDNVSELGNFDGRVHQAEYSSSFQNSENRRDGFNAIVHVQDHSVTALDFPLIRKTPRYPIGQPIQVPVADSIFACHERGFFRE